jgi:hypothetical protein
VAFAHDNPAGEFLSRVPFGAFGKPFNGPLARF